MQTRLGGRRRAKIAGACWVGNTSLPIRSAGESQPTQFSGSIPCGSARSKNHFRIRWETLSVCWDRRSENSEMGCVLSSNTAFYSMALFPKSLGPVSVGVFGNSAVEGPSDWTCTRLYRKDRTGISTILGKLHTSSLTCSTRCAIPTRSSSRSSVSPRSSVRSGHPQLS
jgi:hypothetical protein